MGKKDYVAVAKVVASFSDYALKQQVAHMFANVFEKDNPAFKREVFLQACEVVL